MFTPEDVLYAARKLQPFLSPDTQQALQALLDQAGRGQKVDNRLVDLLSQEPGTKKWLRQALGLGRRSVMSYQPLPGATGVINAPLYVCPHDDFEWEIYRVGQPIPPCPNHHVALEPRPGAGGEEENDGG